MMLKILIAFIILSITIGGCMRDEPIPAEKLYWDDDGMLIIDGKRTFIIGAYHLPKVENPYNELKKSGYNLIRTEAKREALDAAYENQLNTWITTGCLRDDKREDDRKRIAELIGKFKSHPALLCWEIADEPAFTWNSAELRIRPELMIETYWLIKEADPEHPVYTNHGPVNLVSTLKKYNPGTDIVACDIYPVIPHGIIPTYALFPDGLQGDLLNPYISQVGEYADKMHRVVDNSRPVFMVLQGFAWEMLQNAEKRNPEMIEYPTYEQSRFMAYNAIVHGADGINYWGMSYTPQPSPFMEDLNRVTQELASMQPVLSARNFMIKIEKVYHELGHSVDAGVELITKEVNGKLYLITINSDKNPIRVSLSGLDRFSTATVLKESRSVALESGKLTDDYKPFDVHIYELD